MVRHCDAHRRYWLRLTLYSSWESRRGSICYVGYLVASITRSAVWRAGRNTSWKSTRFIGKLLQLAQADAEGIMEAMSREKVAKKLTLIFLVLFVATLIWCSSLESG